MQLFVLLTIALKEPDRTARETALLHELVAGLKHYRPNTSVIVSS